MARAHGESPYICKEMATGYRHGSHDHGLSQKNLIQIDYAQKGPHHGLTGRSHEKPVV